jgi:hypothetical protein
MERICIGMAAYYFVFLFDLQLKSLPRNVARLPEGDERSFQARIDLFLGACAGDSRSAGLCTSEKVILRRHIVNSLKF